jgi:hypothetical protein
VNVNTEGLVYCINMYDQNILFVNLPYLKLLELNQLYHSVRSRTKATELLFLLMMMMMMIVVVIIIIIIENYYNFKTVVA